MAQYTQTEDGLVRWEERDFHGYGYVSNIPPPAQPEKACDLYSNLLPPRDGTIRRRWGTDTFDTTSTGIAAVKMYHYQNAAGSTNRLVVVGDSGGNKVVKSLQATGVVANTGVFTASSGAAYPRAALSRGDMYFQDDVANDRLKWNGNDTAGNGVTTWGFTKPSTAPSAAASGSGSVTIRFWRDYTVAFKNATTGHISDFGPFVRMGPTTAAQQIALTSIPVGATVEGPVSAATIVAGGTGYTLNDLLTPTGGTFSVQAVLKATGVSSGVITTVTVDTGGEYSVAPANPVAVTGGTGNNDATFNLTVGRTTGIGQRVVLATSDGGPRTRLYLVTTITDNTTTTYNDTLTAANLILQNVYVEQNEDGTYAGIKGNDRPPTGKFPIKHRGRIYMTVNKTLRFSKSLAEVATSTTWEVGGRYEESWPPEYEMDIPATTLPTGLFSDGTTLYVGTSDGIYALDGDGPTSFQPIRTLYSTAGVYSQDTFSFVSRSGASIGMMWVTPDFRVLLGDGNTYAEVGFPIHDVVRDAGEASSLTNANTTFASYNGHDVFMLSIGSTGISYNTTWLIYSLQENQWGAWSYTLEGSGILGFGGTFFWVNPSTGLPQILFGHAEHTRLRDFDRSRGQDRDSANANIDMPNSIFRPRWLFGDRYYHLNHIELISQQADANITVAVDGASTNAEFVSPATVQAATSPSDDPLGDRIISLASSTTKDKYYRFDVRLSGTTPVGGRGLSYLAIEAAPLEQT